MKKLFVAVVMCFVLVGCTPVGTLEQDEAAVKAFFQKGAIGGSVDYGIFKRNDVLMPGEPPYLVAVVHGMGDDEDVCKKMIVPLNAEIAEEYRELVRFSCRPLNIVK